jgi:hypothetical protein
MAQIMPTITKINPSNHKPPVGALTPNPSRHLIDFLLCARKGLYADTPNQDVGRRQK